MGVITERKRRNYSGLDADKALIPATSKSIGDTYFATDTKISYTWDGSAWISAGAVGLYVPRACADWDFTDGNFPTLDGNWQVDGLDLSGIVPSGATSVHLICSATGSAAGQRFALRANGSTKALNQIFVFVQVAGILAPFTHAIIYNDADLKLDYLGDLGVSSILVSVLGWWI